CGSETQGFGLGLYIVERLCEHNGWTFTLDVNRGAIDACLSWEPRHLKVDPRASELLGVAQPAIGLQIMSLEEEIGSRSWKP
ncbi:MAG: hypothetical protein RLN69_15640, partial [Woeseiaceae bacterium]